MSSSRLPHTTHLVDLLVDDVSGVEAVIVDADVEKILGHAWLLSCGAGCARSSIITNLWFVRSQSTSDVCVRGDCGGGGGGL